MEEKRAETWLDLQELLFADTWNDRLPALSLELCVPRQLGRRPPT
jgi:hypothetical protein